ncbi:MAG: potassium/proton antiporter [Paludibacteraceae bacterium]|nr:potassium/proton antiporter [Paludibacteraceae bacterium]
MVEFYLLILSVLFIVSIVSDKIGAKFGVPALLLFLLVGMIFGVDGLGLNFANIGLAQAIGTCALCIILFSGGMDTKFETIRPILGQGIVLATIGVVLMAGFTGITWWLLGKTPLLATVPIASCLLIGATMSSTDSASVFSILRTKKIKLKYHLQPMLELESGSNDPVAYILTTTMIGIVNAEFVPSALNIAGTILLQIIIGALVGFLLGNALVWFINKISISNQSLYPILVFASCIFIFSATYYLAGNPYLAVYIGGLMFGNNKFAHKTSTMNFFDGISWLCQLIMFLTLGLLVNPSDMIQSEVWLPALIISVIMIFIARPLSTFICLLGWRKTLPFNARLFVSWVGLRGASPIIFAILCVAAQVPNGNQIFDIVFVCTLISLLIQGTSIPYAAKLLKVEEETKEQHLNIEATSETDILEEAKSVSTEIKITEEMLEGSNLLMDLGLPAHTLAIMVRRPRRSRSGEALFVPTGKTDLRPNDHLLVISNDKNALADLESIILEHAKHKNIAMPVAFQGAIKYLKSRKILSKKNKK